MTNLSKRKKRHRRIRGKISGTKKRPRLSIFKSNKFTYAQLINDKTGNTLVSADSREIKSKNKLKKLKAAQKTGELLAKRAKKKKIKKVVFDRSGYRFHGRVKALAKGARDKGLKF